MSAGKARQATPRVAGMSTLFVSHSSKDSKVAPRICPALESQAIRLRFGGAA